VVITREPRSKLLMPRATGGVKAEYASEEEVQDGSPYHKGNPASGGRHTNRESRATHLLAKAMEEGKNLERNLEEPSTAYGSGMSSQRIQ